MLDQMRVDPGDHPKLGHRDSADKLGLLSKEAAKQELIELTDQLADLQARLWAEDKRSLLVVLQALDAAGKDGTIRQVLTGVNPQGCTVTSFKAPSSDELDHDYLWRVHQVCPRRGEIGIFNRSHYEDVLAVRVMGLVPEDRWRKRYAHIRTFEQLLADEGTAIVKIHLQISFDEQAERMRDRLADPRKSWKFRVADLEVRKQWDQYQEAYEEAIAETSTEDAPWYVVPADRRWVRNVAVSRILVSTLEKMAPEYPPAEPGLESVVID
jgi:PPK2 family polyphosphate:nucleotide phosphotransferase